MSGDLAVMLVGGLAAGALGGLLGIGGGIVLMPLLRFGLGLPPAAAAGTCVLAVFFTTLGGGYRHWRLGHLRLRSVSPVIGAGVLGTAAFSLLFQTLAGHPRLLDLGLGLVFALVSLRMVYEAAASGAPGALAERGEPAVGGTLAQKLGLGAVAGVLPGLLGIGTGGVLVPAFAFLLRSPIKTAVAASLVCFSANAAVSSGFKLAQGHVQLGIALPLAGGALVGANLGALLNRSFPPRGLKLGFGLVFVYVSVRFLVSAGGVRS